MSEVTPALHTAMIHPVPSLHFVGKQVMKDTKEEGTGGQGQQGLVLQQQGEICC